MSATLLWNVSARFMCRNLDYSQFRVTGLSPDVRSFSTRFYVSGLSPDVIISAVPGSAGPSSNATNHWKFREKYPIEPVWISHVLDFLKNN